MAITIDGTNGLTTDNGALKLDTDTLVVDDTNNRVGIGTASPSGMLHLSGALPRIYFTDTDTSTVATFSGENGWLTLSAASSRITFNIAGSEKARIDSVGNLLVGTTSAYTSEGYIHSAVAGATKGAWVSYSGTTSNRIHMRFENPNGVVGSISTSGSATSYTTSSDYRLKEDWQPVSGSVDRVKALNPVNFAWKLDGSRVDGFLAHEAQAVVPEAITGEKDGTEIVDIKDEEGNVTGQEERPLYQGIDQSKLVPLLTAALQDSIAKIEALEARVTALENA